MIIKNVKICTMESDTGTIENGYVEVKNGKITAVGKVAFESEISKKAAALEADSGDIIDGNGGWLLPGLIDAHTHLGICEDSLGFEGDDTNETSDPVSPQLRSIDAINPLERSFAEARESGVTCVAVAPGSSNPIGGQICVIKTVGTRIDSMALNPTNAVKFALGENPKSEYHNKNQSPETRMAVAALIRESLYKAKRYAEDKKRAEEDRTKDEEEAEGIEEPDYDIKNESLIPLLEGKMSAHFHAHRADDIFTAIRIANEFGLKYTLIHCTDGYLIVDELKSESATAIVGPNLCDRSKPELRSLSFKNSGILDKSGVKVAITTDHPVIPLTYLLTCAALAVKNGMSREGALRSVTLSPAEILNLSDRIGSVKVGKDADLALFDGDPLDLMSNTVHVWIDGKTVK